MNTKALMILGSLVGFLIGVGFGLTSGGPWPGKFWRACVAAVVAALLTRWWGRVWLNGLRDTLHHRPTNKGHNAAAKPASSL